MKVTIKKVLFTFLMMAIIFALSISMANSDEHFYKPEIGYVPDEITAIKIAKAVLTPIYGEEKISAENPFQAELKDGVWTVTGTLHCPTGNDCFGGVALIEINKNDGRILRVSHGQ